MSHIRSQPTREKNFYGEYDESMFPNRDIIYGYIIFSEMATLLAMK